jgi:DNA-binding transcriptional MerR regulator/uncharacterized glyoxalase superfamily protein PhnB
MTRTTTRKVGELAEAAGLTVRTLHYYEEIGLLVASERSGAGHRLYTEADVERLYRICLLRRLGFALADVSGALDDPAWSLHAALAAQLHDLDRRLGAIGSLRRRITHLLTSTEPTTGLRGPNAEAGLRGPNAEAGLRGPNAGTGPPDTELLQLLEEMTMLDTTVQRRISILVYADLEAAYGYLTRVFGLGPGQLTRDDGGTVVHGELEAGDGVVWLHPESPAFGLSSPRTVGAATASMAVMVDDVDAHHRHARAEGAPIDYEPVDQPYGYREYSARDSEGGLWSFMKPLD